jgi:hypothetical protein
MTFGRSAAVNRPCSPSERALEFEDDDDTDAALCDVPHQRLHARSLHRAAGVGGIEMAGGFEPSFGCVLRDEIAADRGL